MVFTDKASVTCKSSHLSSLLTAREVSFFLRNIPYSKEWGETAIHKEMPSRVTGRYKPSRWQFSPTASYFWQPWCTRTCIAIYVIFTCKKNYFSPLYLKKLKPPSSPKIETLMNPFMEQTRKKKTEIKTRTFSLHNTNSRQFSSFHTWFLQVSWLLLIQHFLQHLLSLILHHLTLSLLQQLQCWVCCTWKRKWTKITKD